MSTPGLILDSLVFRQGDFELSAGLEVPMGSLSCLLGPSGCGKTTMLRLIGGFCRPAEGKILLKGRDITHIPPHQRRLGIVFQDYALFPHMTVGENILYGLTHRGHTGGNKKDAAQRAARLEDLLGLVRLDGYAGRKIGSLSGGEQQRVALARALAPEPDLLLLDEPLSALDVQLRTALRQEIRRIQETLNLTTLYITHDQEEALALSDRMFVMNRGRVIQDGPPEELYSRPRSLFTGMFLGLSSTLEGRLIRREGSIQLESNGSVFEGIPAGGPEPLREGTQGTLFFRPEDCRILSEPPEPSGTGGAGNTKAAAGEPQSSNCIRGTVKDCEYRGSSLLVYLEVWGQTVRISLPSGSRPRKHSELTVLIPSDRCLLFPGTAG